MIRWYKIIIWGIFVLALIFIILFYFYINPEEYKLGATCSLKKITGLNCPGCGGQRAFHFLLHGQLLKALQYNFLVFLIPFYIYLAFVIIEVYIFKNKNYTKGFLFSKHLGITVLMILIFYTILRNIPYNPFIYLAPPL